jgi:hypothetical protein
MAKVTVFGSKLTVSSIKSTICHIYGGTWWHSGWGTALQIGRSRDRFPMVSLKFFIDTNLPVALWPWVRMSL